MTMKWMFLLPVVVLGQTQTGSIKGSVTATDTNAPLSHVAVMVRPLLSAGRAGRIVRGDTDQKGEFIVSGLAPGSYMLSVQRAGYQGVTYTTGTATARQTRFTVAAGEAKSIQLWLRPLGVVAGTVSGPDGAPLDHAKVMLSHYRTVDGTRVLVPEREVWTDQTGSFRVTGVAPGQFLLSAYSRNEGRLDNVAKIYPPAYYPGVPTPTGAQYIQVGVGQTAGELKLQLGAAQGFAISGQVKDASGAPVAGATVLARRQSEDGTVSLLSSESLTVNAGASGEFLLTRLVPGKYRVMVTAGQGGQRVTGSSAVDLGREDVKNVVVAAGPGAVITGRITFEGNLEGEKGPVSPHLARVSLRPEAGSVGHGVILGAIADDGTFRIENVPEGLARLGISLGSGAYYVKSVSLNGQDVAEQPLKVGKGVRLDGAEVVISLAVAQVSGRVMVDASKQPGTPAPQVILFPEDSQTWRTAPRFIKVGRVNEAGQFTIRGIAPGNYRMVAVRNLAEGSEGDPGFLAAVQGQARQVVVTGRRVNGGILQAVDAPRR